MTFFHISGMELQISSLALESECSFFAILYWRSLQCWHTLDLRQVTVLKDLFLSMECGEHQKFFESIDDQRAKI